MESLEIHSKNYLVRWVNAKPGHTIAWTIQPHKRSINFGLFKHPGHLGGLALHPSVGGLPNLNFLSHKHEDEKDESIPEVVDKLTSIGLKQIVKLGRCDADKSTQGKYEVPHGEAGNYALVFDNTFSKSNSKTVTIFMLTYPTNCQAQIHFGAQTHHSQAMASAISLAPPLTSRRSPKLKVKKKESSESLNTASLNQPLFTPGLTANEKLPTLDEPSSIHTGILQKRRRKRHQGYARRFFCLDYTSSTLSYYHDRNSSALRGAIPLALAAIGANARTREISIDSGAEIWHLKASSKPDFDEWKQALEKASRLMAAATTPGEGLSVRTEFFNSGHAMTTEDGDWARLETILSRIAGTRDAIRRLCVETLSTPAPSQSPGSNSTTTTPTDVGSDDYFKSTERRAFWKRKPSTPSPAMSTLKRSSSSQLAVPGSGNTDATVSASSPPYLTPATTRGNSRRYEDGMHNHMKALLTDLDKVIYEFSSLVAENKQRKSIPRSAMSRMSLQSVDSQEFFDAEDLRSSLLAIPDESDADVDEKTENDSETSSDIEDRSFMDQARGSRSGSLSSLLPPKPKSLTPLPHQPVRRRDTVHAPTVMPPSLIGFLRKNVGKDLSTISMPVSANEPLSLLQRAAEGLEYTSLLEQATKCTDQFERMLYVTAFALSPLSNGRMKERSIRKPFNPMLGETYELVREDMNFRFVSEKVSHRPVQLACYAEGTDWSYAHSPLPSQKFWGKSSEIITEGKARLVLYTPGECYSWVIPTCFLRNIIAGEKYVEPVGTMTIHNDKTGAKAIVTFKAKGMFSGRSEEVDVQVFDAHGVEQSIGLAGTWTHSLQVKEHGKVDASNTIWNVGALVPKPEKHYGMTAFAATLNEITDLEGGKLPPTDSRLRPDQHALEAGQHEKAEELKAALEEAQRARRRELEASGEPWTPRWFSQVEYGGETVWKLKTGSGGYWEERAKGDWKDVVEVLKVE